jgi:hypothetical protein
MKWAVFLLFFVLLCGIVDVVSLKKVKYKTLKSKEERTVQHDPLNHRREYQTNLCSNRFLNGRREGIRDFFSFLEEMQSDSRLSNDGSFELLANEATLDKMINQQEEDWRNNEGVIMYEQILLDTPKQELRDNQIKVRYR